MTRAKRYLKTEQVNGVRLPEEEVSEEFVENFTSKATRTFFENLGGQETLRVRHGRYLCKSISPDGETVREVLFTPIIEKE